MRAKDAEFCAHAREDIPYLLAELQRLTQQQEERDKRITRFELIDRRDLSGRVFTAKLCQIELSYQDEGRTLKIFLRNRYEELAQADLPVLDLATLEASPPVDAVDPNAWTRERGPRAYEDL